MRFDARLTGEAATLAQTHRAMLERLPATFHASLLVELQKWSTLFAPEQAYQRTLLQHLAGLGDLERTALFAAILRVESDAGCDTLRVSDPAKFQDEAQVLLRKKRMLPQWRQEIDRVFQAIDPQVHAQLHPADAPRRVIVQLYGTGISIQAEKLWSRFRDMGVRLPLKLDGVTGADAFLRALFTDRAQSLFGTMAPQPTRAPEAWVIECGEALYALCEKSGNAGAVTGLSYERLRGYRDALTRALYQKIQSGVGSPQEFAAYARSLTIAPGPGVLLYAADVLQAFVRDVLLTGNGTLFVNNTFVEWAAVQALKRAQPRMLVARYGVRDKMKPFSSLLLFSQPRASDQIPLIEDPTGSFVDVEQLSYYVWLNAEKSPAYRQRTLYLFLAEGVDEMLAIRSDRPGTAASTLPAASLADVQASIAAWLGVSGATTGKAIDALVS